jgi:hypothetical protein
MAPATEEEEPAALDSEEEASGAELEEEDREETSVRHPPALTPRRRISLEGRGETPRACIHVAAPTSVLLPPQAGGGNGCRQEEGGGRWQKEVAAGTGEREGREVVGLDSFFSYISSMPRLVACIHCHISMIYATLARTSAPYMLA